MKRRTTAPSTVYFIRDVTSRLIKIGCASAPKQRLKTLQTGSASKLELIGTLPGGQSREAELHQIFAQHRAHGEWFRPSPALINYIDNELGRETDRAREGLYKTAAHLLDALASDTPPEDFRLLLDHEYPICDEEHKTLSYWNAADWTAAATDRYRRASGDMIAARDFDTTIVEPMVQRLQETGVRCTGDLVRRSTIRPA